MEIREFRIDNINAIFFVFNRYQKQVNHIKKLMGNGFCLLP